MSIQCQKCCYVMTQVEAMGYMSAEVYQIFKQVIVPTLLAKAVTKKLERRCL